MVVAILAAEALAGPGLASCCQATNAGACPDTMVVVGPETRQVVSPQGTVVTGLWTFRCEAGATWDPSASQTTTRPYPPATVLTPMMPAAAACFDASCRLPADTCVRYDGKRVYAASCVDGSDATEAMLRSPPRAPRGAVVLGGRIVGGGSPPAPQVASAAPIPTPAPAVQRVDASVPPAPPDPCIPSAALRAPSNEQVDSGNEAIVQGDFATALDRYRAAITINKCNAFAWAALGDALLQSGHPTEAKQALGFATKLMDSNHHAWTLLGQALERTGESATAAAAYRRALELKPGHPPANEGLARVQ